jgi:soluble epoxide hydrolase/lipid-phosphate phosphatase
VHAGYRVLAPDMLGYGGTDKPLDAEEYSTKKLCADLAALLDIVEVSRAVSSGNCDNRSLISSRLFLC